MATVVIATIITCDIVTSDQRTGQSDDNIDYYYCFSLRRLYLAYKEGPSHALIFPIWYFTILWYITIILIVFKKVVSDSSFSSSDSKYSNITVKCIDN